MLTIRNLHFISRCIGVIAAGLIIGFSIQFARSSGQLWTRSLMEACLVAVMSYFAPIIWLRFRYRNEPASVWLVIPVVGSVLLDLTLVRIPNAIAIWNYSSDGTFVANALRALPNQLVYFLVSLLALSALSGIILASAQVIASRLAKTARLPA